MSNRFSEYLQSLPIVTLGLLVLNISVHIAIFLTSAPIHAFAISPNMVLVRHEYYRIFSSAFVHGGLMHILMNMSSLLTLGVILENTFGSLLLLFLTLWSIPLSSVLYIFLNWLLAFITRQPGAMNTSAVGFSGVLFTYALIESFHSLETQRSVFGMFSVPTKTYPVILLVLLSVIVPNISFTGHLAGLLVGVVLITSFGANFLMPSKECIIDIEQSSCGCRCLRPCQQHSVMYIKHRDRELLHSYFTASSAGNVCVQSLQIVLAQMCNILTTILYIIGFPTETVGRMVQNFFRWIYVNVIHLSQTAANTLYSFLCCFRSRSASPYESIPLSDLAERGQTIQNANNVNNSNSSGSKSNSIRYYSSTARTTAASAVHNNSSIRTNSNNNKSNQIIEL